MSLRQGKTHPEQPRCGHSSYDQPTHTPYMCSCSDPRILWGSALLLLCPSQPGTKLRPSNWVQSTELTLQWFPSRALCSKALVSLPSALVETPRGAQDSWKQRSRESVHHKPHLLPAFLLHKASLAHGVQRASYVLGQVREKQEESSNSNPYSYKLGNQNNFHLLAL